MSDLEIYKGNETILLVDDEEFVRIFMTDFLTSLGYNVVIAVEGKEPVEKYLQHTDIIGLVF
ncbi:MAG: hypothetical protein WCP20_03160 [Desulfuromonadales bacterium]